MNKRNLIITAIAVLCLIFAGCAMDQKTPEAKGSLTVRAGAVEGSKGAAPDISMETAYYNIEGKGPVANDSFVRENISAANPIVTIDGLSAGSWTVTATAYNSDGGDIGAGQNTVVINPGDSASCKITVSEYDGEGSFSLMIDGLNDVAGEYIINIYSASNVDEVLRTEKATVNSEGMISVTFYDLPRGFYRVSITPAEGSNMPAHSDSFRIIKDQSTIIKYTVTTSGLIDIENIIATTPRIKIDLKFEKFAVNDNIEATVTTSAFASGLETTWYLDGEVIGNGRNINYTHTFDVGSSHILTFEVYDPDNRILWSESDSFTIIDEIKKPGVLPSTNQFGFEYGKASTIGTFYIGNSGSFESNLWTYQWYIDNEPLAGETDYSRANIPADNSYSLGPHTLELRGTYDNSREYTLYSVESNCYPAISISNSFSSTIISGQTLNFKAEVTPDISSYFVRWYFSPGFSSSTEIPLGTGLEISTDKVTETGYVYAKIEDSNGVILNAAYRYISNVIEGLTIRQNGNTVTSATVYKYDNNGRNSFSTDYINDAVFKWYIDNKEVNQGYNNSSYVSLDVDDYDRGTTLKLKVGVSISGGEELFSDEITLTVDEMPYIRAESFSVNEPGRKEVVFNLVDETGKVTGTPVWELNKNGNTSDAWLETKEDTTGDGRSFTVIVNAPTDPPYSYYSFSINVSVTYQDASGADQNVSGSVSGHLNYRGSGSSGGGTNLVLDNRVAQVGEKINITLSNFGFTQGSDVTRTVDWYLNGELYRTVTDITDSTTALEIDTTELESGSYTVSVDYREEYAGGSSSISCSSYFVVIDQPINVDEVYYRQIFSTGASDDVGYEVIVVDNTNGVFEKSVVLFSSSDAENAFTLKTTDGVIDDLNNIADYIKLAGEVVNSGYLGKWKMPNITPENGLANNLLNRFVNTIPMFSGYVDKLVELAENQTNSVDAYFTIDESFFTVFADIQLAATGFDGSVALPAVFNPQGRATYNYQYADDELTLEGNALGLSFRPSADGKVLVLTAYIPMGEKAQKIVLPLESTSSVKYLPVVNAFSTGKSIRLADELSQLKTIADALDMDDFFLDTMFAFRYGSGSDPANYGGEWVIDEASLANLPVGTPARWITFSDSTILGMSENELNYSIYRSGSSEGYDYTIIGSYFGISDSGNSSYVNKDIQFSNVVISPDGNTVTFDVRTAKQGAVFTSYEGVRAVRSTKNAGELFNDFINGQGSEVDRISLDFTAEGNVVLSMAEGPNNSSMTLDVGTYTDNGDTITVVVDIVDLLMQTGMPDVKGLPDSSAVAITLAYDAGTGKITVLELPKANDSVTLTLK